MNIRVQADGNSLLTLPAESRPGDAITLRAEMDCFVALSACPQDIVRIHGKHDSTPRDVEVKILRENLAPMPVRGPWVPGDRPALVARQTGPAEPRMSRLQFSFAAYASRYVIWTVTMNFNTYLDDETGRKLNAVAERAGESRNALIRRALSEWLKRHGKPGWPNAVLAHKGIADMPVLRPAGTGSSRHAAVRCSQCAGCGRHPCSAQDTRTAYRRLRRADCRLTQAWPGRAPAAVLRNAVCPGRCGPSSAPTWSRSPQPASQLHDRPMSPRG